MAMGSKFAANLVSILGLLQGNVRFVVPRFQRNYSWKTDNVERLWSDIMENFNNYKNDPNSTLDAQYLLGPMVLVRNKEKQNEYWIIDGQQRLSTLTMLFCVARDILQETHPDTKPAGFDKITDLIENTSMGKHVEWKLQLNDTDKDLFMEIQEYEDHELTQLERIKKMKINTTSEKYLQKNYVILYERIMDSLLTRFDGTKLPEDIKDIKEKKSDAELEELRKQNSEMLIYFLTYVIEYNFIVQIEAPDDNTAFQIFETLNHRGQELSKSNLIKNHILNQIKDEETQQNLSNKWNNIFDNIIGEGQPDDEFIMESLRSRHPYKEIKLRKNPNKHLKISKKNLYVIIKDQNNDEKECKKYIKELKDDADFLTQLNEPVLYTDDETKDDVYALKALSAKFIRIPILTAYRKWGLNDDYRHLVEFLVLFFFKFRTIRETHPGIVEKVILDATKMILDGNSLTDIIKKIKKKDDQVDFEYKFERFMADPSKDVARYILYKITLYLGTENNDVRPIDKLTLEHILPKTYGASWNKNDFFDDMDDVDVNMDYQVTRLGNLTLLHSAINSSIANSSFQVKKERGYSNSKLDINIETVCKNNQWNAKIIQEREKLFLNYARNIWDLDRFSSL